jgi:hypothetical protein
LLLAFLNWDQILVNCCLDLQWQNIANILLSFRTSLCKISKVLDLSVNLINIIVQDPNGSIELVKLGLMHAHEGVCLSVLVLDGLEILPNLVMLLGHLPLQV